MGTLIIKEDGTYALGHMVSGTAFGTWRQGGKNEVIGYDDMLILEQGPGGIDWTIIPKTDGLVSVRYYYGYTGENKIWIEDCLGILLEN